MERSASQQNQNIGVIADRISRYLMIGNGESWKKRLQKKSNCMVIAFESPHLCHPCDPGLNLFGREGGNEFLKSGIGAQGIPEWIEA